MGCSDDEGWEREDYFPAVPAGAELVLEIGELEVYKAFPGTLCPGTLRRIEDHTHGLAELFGREPPPARLILHDEQAPLDELCPIPGVRGCVDGVGAHSLPVAAPHELAHLFVNEVMHWAKTRRAIREGLALRLEGSHAKRPGSAPASLEQWRQELAVRSVRERLSTPVLRHMFAWAVEEAGLDAVIEAHIATSYDDVYDDDEKVEVALAESLGFPSLEDMHAAYLEGHAFRYPRLPDTIAIVGTDELEAGFRLDTSCEAPFAEGPSAGVLTTTLRMEIPRAGEYEIAYEPLPFLGPPGRPNLSPTEPVFDEQWYFDIRAPSDCNPYHPVRMLFTVPGYYEIEYETGLDDPYVAEFWARYQGAECSPD